MTTCGMADGCMAPTQVFNVFNRVLGFFIRSKRIDFDDDWEEKSELAGNGARLLRCAASCPQTLPVTQPETAC